MSKLPKRPRLFSFLIGLLSCCLPVITLQAQSAAQLQLFQSLSPDQQQALLQQVSGGGSVPGAQPDKRQAGKRADEAQQRAPLDRVDRSDRPDELMGMLKPGDTIIVQINMKTATSPGAPAAGGSTVAAPTPAALATIDIVRSRNPFRLDSLGQLDLPGFPPMALGGLTEEQANQRLASDPALAGFETRLSRLTLAKTGLAALKPFGYDLFDDAPSTFSPVTDVPVPADYVMGAGDEIGVQLFGGQNRSLRLVVGRDGTVSFPELGPINVAGLSFSAAKSTIESRVAQQMIGVRANVTMGDMRSIRVFVLGEARRPGSYRISGLGTMTSALFASGGVVS